MTHKLPEQEHFLKYTINLLSSRGVNLKDIGDLVLSLQKPYIKGITKEMVYNSILKVLSKREVQNAIMTGVELDKLAEEITFSITNLYGSIGFTNYGYLDKLKPGILQWLNDRSTGFINVYLDDLVGAVAAAAAARLAHKELDKEDGDSVYLKGYQLPDLDKDFKEQEIARRAIKGRQMPTPEKLYWGKTEVRYNKMNAKPEEILAFLKQNDFPKNHKPFVAIKNNTLGDIFVY